MKKRTEDLSPLVSILIPAYNCARYIEQTVDSCLAQTYSNIEIIVVDDGSTDSTPEVLKKYGDKIRVLRQANAGLPAARNVAHRMAKGDYVAWLDGDDIAHPHRIALQVAALNQCEDIVLVSTDFSAFTDNQPDYENSHIGTYYNSFKSRGGAERLFEKQFALNSPIENVKAINLFVGHQFEHLVWGNFVHPPTVMARKKNLDQIEGFDENLRACSDFEFIVRLSRVGNFGFIDYPLLRYRRSDQQKSASYQDGKMWREYRQLLQKFFLLEPEYFKSRAKQFKKTTAMTYVHEAKTIGNQNRIKALRLLAHGFREPSAWRAIRKSLVYILMPEFVFTWVRKYKRRKENHN